MSEIIEAVCKNCSQTQPFKTVYLKKDGKSCYDCGSEVPLEFRFFGYESLRDKFAMTALNGILAWGWNHFGGPSPNPKENIDFASGKFAERAYAIADKMLEERKK